MRVRESEAALLPRYWAYDLGAKTVGAAVSVTGGLTVYNAEVLRQLEGEGYCVAPNHRSLWDGPLVGIGMWRLPKYTSGTEEDALEPRLVHFLAKDGLWKVPVLDKFLDSVGAEPIERGTGRGLRQDQIDHIGWLIENKAVIGMFPEGHRNKKEQADIEAVRREKLHTTIGLLALMFGMTIVPVGIRHRTMVIGDPMRHQKLQLDVADPEFKQAKYAVIDELCARTNDAYQLARQLDKRWRIRKSSSPIPTMATADR